MNARGLLAVLCLTGLGCSEPAPTAPDDAADVAAIRDVFAAHREAIVTGDGVALVKTVSSDTLAFYDAALELARGADADRLRAAPVGDQLQALLLRVRLEPEALRAMSAGDLLRHGLRSGWIPREAVIDAELGDVAVAGDSAVGENRFGDRSLPLPWFFARDPDGWRVDIARQLQRSHEPLAQAAAQRGDGEALIAEMIRAATGVELRPEHWNP